MSGARWLAKLGAVAVLFAAVACGTPCCGLKIYEIKRGGDPKGNLNILFLSDGFNETDLPLYRAAASHLTESLVEAWPFCNVRDQLNFYRIDVVDTDGLTNQGNCEGQCPASTTLDGPGIFKEIDPAEDPPGWKSFVEQDLEVTRCFNSSGVGTGSCLLLWPSAAGEFAARELMRCGPDISVVVVIANSELENGGGLAKVSAATANMAVVGVPIDDTGGGMFGMTSIRTVTPSGQRLFAHELAHALGLLDEYIGTSSNPPSISTDRNVWQPSAPPWGTGEDSPPWADLLGTCPPTGMEPCTRAPFSTSPCLKCENNPTQTGCLYIPADTQDNLGDCFPCDEPIGCPACNGLACPWNPACSDDPFCKDNPAAWEGAHHARYGLYRSQFMCVMKTFDGPPFCDACAAYLWTTHFCSDLACPDLSDFMAPCN